MTNATEAGGEIAAGGEAAAVKPAAKFVPGKSRDRVVPLEYPVEFAGKTYDSITVRRMTGNEVAEFVANSADVKTLPMFDCPKEVIDALDADDSETLMTAVLDFLPRALRPAND